ncbi:hypothetical protein C9I57_31750 [Trinickia symbiotica]|uniref:Transcription factor LuxR-like autoinducer-binding domain-containing protein n=1 Tax=Trinickia symbiotica TaxID=863227 RepID=A0A2T3XJQ1_9BURK|nr:autoinducer binding domain-containing protein [Trinickia symbiotica]PTB16764.1 hypothetical protein C9I57_31750 [Trinickia symbiotica]
MHAWRETYLNSVAAAKSEADMFRELAAAARELGFGHCSFGIRVPFPVSKPQFTLQSDYPDAWVERYVSRNYFAVDPTLRHALTQPHPLIWRADNQTQSAELWEEAAHFGLRHGWCMPSISRTGAIGLVTMVRSGERRANAARALFRAGNRRPLRGTTSNIGACHRCATHWPAAASDSSAVSATRGSSASALKSTMLDGICT